MKAFNTARKGAALTEYGIVVGLVSVLAIGAVLGTGTEVKTVFCIATNGVREGMAKASNTEFVPIGICSFDVADSDLSGSPEAPGASDGTDSGAGTQPIAPTGEIGISTASTLFTEAGMVMLSGLKSRASFPYQNGDETVISD
jgi:Flp pilus assembly pilin Flp